MKVVVALSGGVDSSTAAYLLKQQGYDVIGVTLQLYKDSACCGIAAIADAKKVASLLNIPHYTLNFEEVFKKYVIKDFINEYKRGRTPNPCIRCNKYIKFNLLLKKVKELNCSYIATGHYARIEYKEGRYLLKKGIDEKKEQSYVLYPLTQNQLKHTLFPLGNYRKEEIRRIAKEANLPVAEKEESQEICFIPDNNYPKFLSKYLKRERGDILDKYGNKLGEHNGIFNYTIGQRKRINIPKQIPLYVLAIINNNIIVGTEEDLYKDELIVKNCNFISIEKLSAPLQVKVKIRYKQDEQEALISPLSNNRVKVEFKNKVRAITPGQSAVFYQDDIILGGGIIEQ